VSRRVVMVVFPDLQVLDLTGPHEVFSLANRALGHQAYDVEVVAHAADPADPADPADAGTGGVRASCGLRLGVDRRVGAGTSDPDLVSA
jgi:transcriptional regulator GlxA family with amidase domain